MIMTKLRRIPSVWVILLLPVIVIAFCQWSMLYTMYGRQELLPDNVQSGTGEPTNDDTSACRILKGKQKLVREPVYLACYPGSGSEVTLNLIESMTGVKTIAHGGRCDPPETPYDYVALKTHYPWHCRKVNEWQHGLLSRAVVLIRNPIHALPSRANRAYESTHKETPHSAQASQEYWTRWRDKRFTTELTLWEELVHYWFENYPPDNRLFVPYEQLVSGPNMTRKLAQFFNVTRSTGCVWQEVVAGDKSGRRSNIHRKKTYTPDFTMEQYDVISRVLSRLSRTFEQESFGWSIKEYAKAVEERKMSMKSQNATNALIETYIEMDGRG